MMAVASPCAISLARSTTSDAAGGPLDVTLVVDRATVAAPEECQTGSSALLRTLSILDDRVNPPVAVNVEEPWRCQRDQLTARDRW
jgi:hypothetical protein